MEAFFEEAAPVRSNYLIKHWRGELSLPVSYWVNGVLITGLVPILLAYLAATAEQNGASIQTSSAIIMAVILATILLSVWSIVGTWRSADNHEERGGSSFWANVAKFLMFLGSIRLLFQIATLGPFTLETVQLAAGSDPLGAPATVTVAGDSMTLVGPFSMGTADRVIDAFQKNPEIKQLTLTSIGGRLAEAATISKLVQARQLETVADKECSSACTMVLVSGRDRSAMPGSKVGFHSPSYPGLGAIEINAAASLMADSYRAAGIADSFVDQALAVDAATLWYPKEAQLFEVGVLNFMNPKRIEIAHRYEEMSYKGKLPQRIDDVTTLERVIATGSAIKYIYKANIAPGSVSSSEARTLLLKDVKTRFCAIDLLPDMVASGARYEFVYHYRAGGVLTQFSIDSC